MRLVQALKLAVLDKAEKLLLLPVAKAIPRSSASIK